MIHVEDAIAKGKKGLAATLGQVSGEFSYDETAYHLPVTYALTGMAVHSGDTARKAYAQTGENPLVAGECSHRLGHHCRRKGTPSLFRVYPGCRI